MELTGFVLRRDDSGLYWNKREWSQIPHVYMNSGHVKNAAHYHCDNYKCVKIPYSIITATVKTTDGEVLLSKKIGDAK